MSTLSHKNSKKGLDVLEHQDVHIEKENSYKVHINKIHDFSEVKMRPTELDPAAVDKPKNPQVSPYVKVEELVKDKPKGNSEFASRMKEVRAYVRELKDIKKIKMLEFDLSGLESEDDYDEVVMVIHRAAEKDIINQKEKGDMLNLLRGFSLKAESVEESGISLEEAREEYVRHYAEWEKKSRTAKKMFIKALANLGASKPVPERISQKSSELTEAMREYMGARKRKMSTLSEADAMEFLVKEKELVDEKVNVIREEHEKVRLEKALNAWEKLPAEPSTHRALLANAVLSDGANFSTVFSGLASATTGFTGFRAHREIKEEAVVTAQSADPIQAPSEKMEDRYISIGKNFRAAAAGAQSSVVDGVREDALSQKESAMKSLIVGEMDEKKRHRLAKASKLVGVEYAEGDSAPAKKGLFGGLAAALGLDSVEAKHAFVQEKPPQLEQNMPLVSDQSEKAKETRIGMSGVHLSGSEIPGSGQIPYLETFIDIVDTGVARKILMNSIEIAIEVPFGSAKMFCLHDKFQEGADFRTIRDAFTVALKSAVNLQNVAKQSTILDFEGGKIYIFAGFADDPNGIKVLLNGKEIAKGVYKGGARVALLDTPGIKSGWLLSDTVYERAFKKAEPVLKSIKII